MKSLLGRIPSWLRNRYGVALLVLFAWIALFDEYDLWTMYKLRRQLGKMRTEKTWYQDQIIGTREQLHELTSDKALLEKFARERYLMKRKDEEIFLLVPEK
ncbi:MAG: septum formation initiator family protein [Flavobacteriales bacterium]|nr:septum formation initiator family protein [Flavobacteriales bacterium]MCB9167780.1 septum formation initiator family protein [Flavobacteriales bacterium]